MPKPSTLEIALQHLTSLSNIRNRTSTRDITSQHSKSHFIATRRIATRPIATRPITTRPIATPLATERVRRQTGDPSDQNLNENFKFLMRVQGGALVSSAQSIRKHCSTRFYPNSTSESKTQHPSSGTKKKSFYIWSGVMLL